MNTDSQKAERLLVLTERLSEALRADIEALERGRPREMRSPKPDVQQMTALYSGEATGITLAAVNALPKDTRDKLVASSVRFRQILESHNRVLTRVKTASEGMIRCIAEEVAKKKSAQRPYSPAPTAASRSPGAMLFNNVV